MRNAKRRWKMKETNNFRIVSNVRVLVRYRFKSPVLLICKINDHVYAGFPYLFIFLLFFHSILFYSKNWLWSLKLYTLATFHTAVTFILMNITSLSATKISHNAPIVRHGFINLKYPIHRNVQACTVHSSTEMGGGRWDWWRIQIGSLSILITSKRVSYPQHKFVFTIVGNVEADERTIHSRLLWTL